MGKGAKSSEVIGIKAKGLLSKAKKKKSKTAKLVIENRKIEELAFLASIVNSSDDAIIGKTLDGIITSWNPAAEKVFGYSSKEVTGKSISILIPLHLQKEEKKILEQIRSGKVVDHYETKRIRKDGKIIDVSLIISPIRDSQGNIIGASKILRDITDLKKAEEKLAIREEYFRHTLDNMLEGVQIHDFEWRYTYVNKALVRFSHYSKEELLGHSLMEKYPGIEQTNLFKVMNRCMIGRITEHLETEFTFPDGSKADFELSIQPVPQGIFILSIDITKRKKAEEQIKQLNESLEIKVKGRTAQLQATVQQLKESEEKFQKAFQASACGIAITRLSDSAYMDVNDAFVLMTGYTREELIGHTSTELGIVLTIKKREEILQEIKEQGSARNFEITVLHKSGRQLEVISSAETILLKGKQYAINVIYDITDRKLAEEQLRIANKELESFSYSVSHDLRAPLRAINGNAKILEEDYLEKFDGDGLLALQSIMRNSQRMGTLIDDLLAFSKLGRKHLTASEIDMMTLVKSTIEEFLTDDIRDRTVINIDMLPPAKGDQSLIKQVWINLISNAIKYSKNKPKIEIKIGANENDSMVVYHVKDSGVGFDMKYYDKLFGVFQRLHSQEEFEGTGIGLANIQKIVHRHNGTVWAESIPNEGACFYFSLPNVQSGLKNLNS